MTFHEKKYFDDLTGDQITVQDFVQAVQEAKEAKDRTTVNVVVTGSGTPLNAVIEGINPDTIEYRSGCVFVGSWADTYSLTVPAAGEIYVCDITSADDLKHSTAVLQYTFWVNEYLSVAFIFSFETGE